jgi:hypothetical protein
LLATVAMLLAIEDRLRRATGIELGSSTGGAWNPLSHNRSASTSRPGARAAAAERPRAAHRPATQAVPEAGRFITGARSPGDPRRQPDEQVAGVRRRGRRDSGADAPGAYPDAYHPSPCTTIAEIALQCIDVVARCARTTTARDPARASGRTGDLLLIHDTGAHALAMGFNYNGRLRPQEPRCAAMAASS